MADFAFKPGTTVGQHDTIVRLKKMGLSHSNIGAHLGTTESAVQQAVSLLKKNGRLKDEDVPPRNWAQARREGRKMRGVPRTPPLGESDD